MATETDMRLRSWLDSNQRDRERMSRAILSLDERYSDVRPRHPSGGPDGGRDIEATFENNREAYGAVGFANGANDSDEQKRKIRKKFKADIASALVANPQLKVFAFLTNVHFTMGQQDEMKKEAKKAGIEHCDILDRERIRIELDQPSGFFIRFQYLSIALSEAEQASFLARYGNQIQEVVTSGFQRVEKTLNRLLFLSEANDRLGTLSFRFNLKESYLASAIGHLRAFVFLSLQEHTDDHALVWFGTSDRSDRFRDDGKRDMKPGIANGRGTGQYVWYTPPSDRGDTSAERTEGEDEDPQQVADEKSGFMLAGWSSGVGMDQVSVILAQYRHGQFQGPDRPRLSVRNLDDCSFLPYFNASLAEKVHSFQVFANGYKLADFGPTDFKIDRTRCGENLPGNFTEEELKDPWVRIRPSTISSAFHIRFADTTPRFGAGGEGSLQALLWVQGAKAPGRGDARESGSLPARDPTARRWRDKGNDRERLRLRVMNRVTLAGVSNRGLRLSPLWQDVRYYRTHLALAAKGGSRSAT